MHEGAPGRDWTVLVLLGGLFCSSAGTVALGTVLGLQVYGISGREFDLGLIGLFQFAPAMALVLVTGSIADRYDRRRIAAAGLLGSALSALGFLWYATTEPTAVGPIFLLTLVYGTARAFTAPAARALPADVVAPERLPWVVARYAGSWQVAAIVGPVIGGFLYEVDVPLGYAFVAALGTVAAVAVYLVPRREELATAAAVEQVAELVEDIAPSDPEPAMVPQARFGEALAGLRFIRSHQILLGAISLDLFAVLFGGAVALLPAIAEQRLGIDGVGLGWLRAADGIGAALVTASLAVRPLRRKVGRTLLLSVGVFGAATIVLGLTRNFAVAFAAVLVLSGADAVSVFVRGTLAPLVTPKDKRGRVLAVEGVFIGASNELGAFESGVAGQVLGPGGAVVLGGAATLAVAAGWGVLFPALREVDEFPDGQSGSST